MQETISEVDQTWKESYTIFSEERSIAVMAYNKSSEVCPVFFSKSCT